MNRLDKKQLILGFTAIKEMSKLMISKLMSQFRPKYSFWGFKIDLVRAIRVVTLTLLKKRTDLQGVIIDIWGEGVQIRKKIQFRMAFRFLEGTSISNQSSDALFSFAVFQNMFCYFDNMPC